MTDSMTPETPDVWKDVERWDVTGTYVQRMSVKFGTFPRGLWMRSEDVNAARAVDAATIASLQGHIDELEADVARLESRLEQAHVEPGEVHE